MRRARVAILGAGLALVTCSDGPTPPEGGSGTGITFTAASLQSFSAQGTPDPSDVLARSFALAFADSLNGLFAMGYHARSSASGDVLILQLPRQVGTYSCGESMQCHGRLFTGVSLFEHEDGVVGWTVEDSYEIRSGSVTAAQVGPTRLRGTFEVIMSTADSLTTLQVTHGQIDVQYNSTPPAPGESTRSVECLLRLAAGQQVTCG